jgi:hypothetical protein
VPGDVDANALSGTCPCIVYVDGHSHGDGNGEQESATEGADTASRTYDLRMASRPDPDERRELKRAFRKAERAIDPDVLAASLAHFGGYCDCEVVANVNPEEIFE